MKIKHLGFTTFSISFPNLTIITDPTALLDTGLKLPKTPADVVLFSKEEYVGNGGVLKKAKVDKVVVDNREEIMEIVNSGEYEISEVLIQRPMDHSYYIIDHGFIRIVYLGLDSSDIDPVNYKDFGDVDVLMLPVGDRDMFPGYDKLQKVISQIDPTYLIPSGFKQEGMTGKYAEMKSREEFIKHFGFTKLREEKTLNVKNIPESDQRSMEVIILD